MDGDRIPVGMVGTVIVCEEGIPVFHAVISRSEENMVSVAFGGVEDADVHERLGEWLHLLAQALLFNSSKVDLKELIRRGIDLADYEDGVEGEPPYPVDVSDIPF